MSKKLIESFIWGIGRGLGNTASKRTSEYVGGKIINPKSKFRKRIERFDLGGEFNSARKKLMTLIEMFHEEYIINKDNLPYMQVGTYIQMDVKIIDSKMRLLRSMVTDEESQMNTYNMVESFWINVKTELTNG